MELIDLGATGDDALEHVAETSLRIAPWEFSRTTNYTDRCCSGAEGRSFTIAGEALMIGQIASRVSYYGKVPHPSV